MFYILSILSSFETVMWENILLLKIDPPIQVERIVILKVESLWKKFDIKLDIHSGNSS